MIVTPHRTFAIWNFLTALDVIPTVRTMVDGVQEQALVLGRTGKIRFAKQGVQNGQTGRAVVAARPLPQITSQAKQTLSGDRRRGTVDRLIFVEWVRSTLHVTEEMRPGRSCIPDRDTAGETVLNIKIRGCCG